MVINNKCSSCGGELVFDTKSQELKCCQCDSIVDIPEQEAEFTKKELNVKSSIEESKTKYCQFTCHTCGGRHIVLTENDLTKCPSCGDNNLTKNVNIEYMPDGIIPFKLDKDTALACFKQWIKKAKFVPNKLKKTSAENFFGVYFPAYCYDFNCHSTYHGVGITYIRTKVGNTTHVTSKQQYFSGSRNDTYRNYLDSASTQFNAFNIRKISNYSFGKIYVYRPEFLYGWIGTEVDVNLQDSCKRVKSIINQEIKDLARRLETRYDRVENFSCETTYEMQKYGYLYLPIWTCNYKFRNKIYNCYINGETGKTTGKTPKSFWKIFGLTMSILGAIGLGAFVLIKYFNILG